MTSRVGIRDIVRNFNAIQEYDYVMVEDKKSNQLKGIFVSSKLANDVKEFLDKKIEEQKQKELNEILKFVGKGEIKEEFNNLNTKEIKEKIAKANYDK